MKVLKGREIHLNKGKIVKDTKERTAEVMEEDEKKLDKKHAEKEQRTETKVKHTQEPEAHKHQEEKKQEQEE